MSKFWFVSNRNPSRVGLGRLKKNEQIMKSVEKLIDKYYEILFHQICKIHDDLYELKIEYRERSTGKTIIVSYLDREKTLREAENGQASPELGQLSDGQASPDWSGLVTGYYWGRKLL